MASIEESMVKLAEKQPCGILPGSESSLSTNQSINIKNGFKKELSCDGSTQGFISTVKEEMGWLTEAIAPIQKEESNSNSDICHEKSIELIFPGNQIVDTLDNLGSTDKTIVINAISNISMMASGETNGPANRYQLGSLEAPTLIVLLMTGKHGKDPNLQVEACRALANLSFRNPYNRDVIARVGGINAVIQSMRAFPNHSLLQVCGVRALQNLFYKSDSNKLKALEQDGVAVVLGAMNRNPNNEWLKIHGSRCIRNLWRSKNTSSDNSATTAPGGKSNQNDNRKAIEDKNNSEDVAVDDDRNITDEIAQIDLSRRQQE